MLGLNARIALRGGAAVLSVLAVVWLALWYFIPTPPSTITIATSPAYEHIAQHYQERLARHHVKLVIRSANSSEADMTIVLIHCRLTGQRLHQELALLRTGLGENLTRIIE